MLKIQSKWGSEAERKVHILFPCLSEWLSEDVNNDGSVNAIDLILVASHFGESGQNDVDVNGDGVVNITDLTLVMAAFGSTAGAPEIWSLALSRGQVDAGRGRTVAASGTASSLDRCCVSAWDFDVETTP